MEADKTTVLLLDKSRDDQIARIEAIGRERMEVTCISSVSTAREHLATGAYDAILVHQRAAGDMLLAFCRQARLRDPKLVIVSSLAIRTDRLEHDLFDCGVNDVISDDHSAATIAKRLAVRLADYRKMGLQHNGIDLGDVRIDVARREVLRAGRRILLTRRQTQLLAYFLANTERVISRRELLENIWKDTVNPNGKNLDMYISQLRRVLEAEPTNPVHLLTVRSAGYRFVLDGAQVWGVTRPADREVRE
jgi:two-component system, OmpR family, response regulator RegX3